MGSGFMGGTMDGGRASAVHKAEPKPGTIYSAEGINTGLEANPDYPSHYPMTAHCSCGEILRRVWYPELQVAGFWQHTGRQAGE